MGIFNEFFKKEKPVFTGLKFGFGSGGGAAAADPVTLATGGTVTQPGNGYAYHYFDGVADVYTSNVANDTIFANYSLETRSVGQLGFATPAAKSFCLVLKSAQETVDVRTQITGGSTSSTYSFWYSTDNGTSFSPHPQTHTGSMNGSTAVTIGPHADGVTHVVYSQGGNGNRYYWAPTPVATFVPNGPKTIDIVMTAGGGGGGGTSGGGAGGLVHYANKAVTTGTITFAIGVGGLHGPGAAPGADQVGADTTLSGPDFPATITAKGGGGGGAFNVSDLPRAGGSGGGGYSDAGGTNQGPGGPATQPGLNPTYTPQALGPFNQYGSNGGAGSTKIGYVYGGGGGGAGAVGGALPGGDAPNLDYNSANNATGGNGIAIPGFEYPLWSTADLTPHSPSNNHFGGGGGAGSSPGNPGGYGGGGNGGNAYPVAGGIPTLGGGAGGNGSGNGSGGSGGVIIRYSLT